MLRVGVVGVGGMGQAHASALPKVEGAQFAAVCDTRPEAAQAAAERFGVRGGYVALNWERDRLPLVQAITDTPFFQKLRSDLVVSFYNQKDLWPRFGYEGPSWEHGGYLERGFNDLDWLPEV